MRWQRAIENGDWHYNCLPSIATRYVSTLTLRLGLTYMQLLASHKRMSITIVEIVSPPEKWPSKVTQALHIM